MVLLERMSGRQVAPEASLESAADHVLFPEESLQKSQAPLPVDREQERVKRVDQGDMSARECLFAHNGKYTVAQRYPLPLETLSLPPFDSHVSRQTAHELYIIFLRGEAQAPSRVGWWI